MMVCRAYLVQEVLEKVICFGGNVVRSQLEG